MEAVGVNESFWRGKRVFITGHTGFKGGWLALWLANMGAQVHGYSLAPEVAPNLFEVARVREDMGDSCIADVRDGKSLTQQLRAAKPQIVFHLAAQSLVRYGYAQPVETYSVNVMGTVNLLEAVRATPGVRAVVNVTSDKCYENREWVWSYREDEPIGGHDPYSSSKGCAELVTSAYRRSFLEAAGVAVASARAGNVIGGGDWASDRLVPDFLRALDSGKAAVVRSPDAIRPWQHVLEPLGGYLLLAERLYTDGSAFGEGWNFGPGDDDVRPVRWVVDRLVSASRSATWESDRSVGPHEAGYLKLDSSKARYRLGWQPRWRLETALEKTLEWHSAWRNGKDMHAVSLSQIADYLESGSTG